jgi:hypothetical protein
MSSLAARSFTALALSFIMGLVAGCGPGDSARHTAAQTDVSPSSPGAPVKLPPVALGAFIGTVGFTENGVLTKAHANATCEVVEDGDRYLLRFSGGTPAVDAEVPTLRGLVFVATPGSQIGVFHTLEGNGSTAGIHLSTTMTNLNVDVPSGARRLIFTGRK